MSTALETKLANALRMCAEAHAWDTAQRVMINDAMSSFTASEADTVMYAATIERARDQWASDDLEIDDSPAVCPGCDDGVWVAAWVWVANKSDEDNEEGEDNVDFSLPIGLSRGGDV